MSKRRKTPEELIEALARQVKRGFDDTVSKRELLELHQNIDIKFKTVAEAVERLEGSVDEAKAIVRPVARAMPDHEFRIRRLERRTGFAK